MNPTGAVDPSFRETGHGSFYSPSGRPAKAGPKEAWEEKPAVAVGAQARPAAQADNAGLHPAAASPEAEGGAVATRRAINALASSAVRTP